MTGVLAHAQTTQLSQSGSDYQSKTLYTQLVILSTTVDRANDTLTIRGLGFGTRTPQVWCETHQMTVLNSSDSKIVVYLPDSTHDGSYLLTVLRGYQSNERDVFDMAIQSAARGPVGPKGDSGAAGPKGDTGAAGPKGDTGAAGPKGDTGATGATGATGVAGPQGAQGDVGPAGAQGEVGATGATGATGAAGPQGEAGAAGAAGPAGPQGPDGAQGAAGPQGPAGAQGQGGVQGPMGLQGPEGPVGPAGVSGYEIVTLLHTVSLNGNNTTAAQVACPAGKRVIGGGFEGVNPNIPLYPVASYPSAVDNTWRTTLRLTQIPGIANLQFRTYAVCVAQ